MDNEFIFLVLLPASLFDLSRYSIPNELCVAGLFISLIRHLESQGLTGVWPWLAGMVIPLFLYFFLWKLRMFGAADGKLLAVCGSYTGPQGVFFILFFSLAAGAFISLFRMIINKNAMERLKSIAAYAGAVRSAGKLQRYTDIVSRSEDALIPFGLAISFAMIMYLAS